MARIQYSGLVTAINGSVGGTTFQTNKYGFTVKNKANMVHPRTSLQSNQKLALSVAITRWRALSSPQRSLWDSWALAYPQYAKHNPTAQLSGFNVFIKRMVFQLMFFGLDQPAITNPEFVTYPLDTCTVSPVRSGGLLYLRPVWSIADETLTCLYFMSNTLPPSVNFIGSKTRFIGSNYNINEDIDITTEYKVAFGIVPNVGTTCVIDLQIMANTNGQVFARSRQRVTVGTA
jgi:hypothetical protein